MKAERFNVLLRLLDEGDEVALTEIQREYGRLIKLVACSILNDWHYSSDILNEVMLILWNKSHKFRSIKDPVACICDLAKKASYNFYRKYLKKLGHEIRLDNIPKKEATRHLIHNDDYSDVNFNEAIANLDEIEKEIIIRKIAFKLTHAEIATDLNMPEGTIKWQYYEILKKLRKNIPKDKDSS